jgi:DNA-binding response OmpR family regulator
VLVLEDEASLLALARRVLEKHGYTVLEAATVGAAESLARDYAGVIHLLLTDVVLPDGSSRELADRLRGQRPDLKTLFMSGYTADTVNVPFLGKPFSAEALVAKVREVLDR